MEMEIGSEEAPSSSSTTVVKGMWNGIWKLQVPNCIRSFMWHAGFDSLPTRVNLARSKLMTKIVYPHYKLGPEDTIHAL